LGNLFNRFAVPVFVLLLLSMLDIVMGAFSHSRTSFSVMAGEDVNLSGDLEKAVDEAWFKSTHELSPAQRMVLINQILGYTPQNDFLKLEFKEVRGRFWRGRLAVGPTAPQGEITITVFQHSYPNDVSRYQVRIFRDFAAYKSSLPSLSERYLGFPPWAVTLFLFPLAVILILINFLQSGKADRDLQAAGIGPIYKLARRKDHWEVVFGLGSQHGVQEGDTLILMDHQHTPVGEIKADVVRSESSTAALPISVTVTPRHMVVRRQ